MRFFGVKVMLVQDYYERINEIQEELTDQLREATANLSTYTDSLTDVELAVETYKENTRHYNAESLAEIERIRQRGGAFEDPKFQQIVDDTNTLISFFQNVTKITFEVFFTELEIKLNEVYDKQAGSEDYLSQFDEYSLPKFDFGKS